MSTFITVAMLLVLSDLVLNDWVDTGEDKTRDISYTLSLNYSIGPKSSPSTEKQV
jgi:hypothetical protein